MIPWPKSLKIKLMLGSAATALVILAVTWLLLSGAARDTAIQEARAQSESLSRYCSEALAEPVAARDRLQVHLLVRALIRSGVADISVTTIDGEELHTSAFDLSQGPSMDSESFPGGVMASDTVDDETLIHMTNPIRFGGKPVGVLHLWLSQRDLEEKIREAL